MTRSLRPFLAARLALRGLERDPSSSVTAILVLALGLAAPATFASLLVGATRPLPVPEGDRVARVDVVLPSDDGRGLAVTRRDLEAWQDAAALSAVGGFQVVQATLVDPSVAATRLSVALVTPSLLPLLRVPPRIGRLPGPGEEDHALVLGHGVWVDVFEADPGVIGRAVEVDGAPRAVTAVMPEGFGFPFNQQAWLVAPGTRAGGRGPTPLDVAAPGPARDVGGVASPDDPAPGAGPATAAGAEPAFPVAAGGSDSWEVVARLADGATLASAAAELGLRWARLDPQRPASDAGGVVQVRDFTSGRGEGGEAVAFGGLVLVGVCLLLIACANVANLLLVRATERVRMLGVQAALGAGRGQLALQLFTEALVLAAAGGALGLLLAHVVVSWVQATSSANFGYYWMRMAVDAPVFAFTGALVTMTAVVAGSLPVRRVLRLDVQGVLKAGAAGDAFGGGGRLARGFVTAQLAMSCAALVAAGLATQAMAHAHGFGGSLPADEVLLARIHVGDGPQAGAVRDALLAEVAARPGVRAAALGIGAPGGGEPFGLLEAEGVLYERGRDRPFTMTNAVTPGFFSLFELDLLRGRMLGAGDVFGSERVAVVNESFARRFAPGGDVIGRRYRVAALDSAWLTVVGVVEDAPVGGGADMRLDRIYQALDQTELSAPILLLRADGPAGTLAPGLRASVAAVDPRLAVTDVRTLADLHDYMTRAQATLSSLGAGGGFAGLVVAAVGLYGLLAFRVRQRRRELGVRLALGADGSRLAREILGIAFRQLLPATAAGLALAWLAAPVLRVLLLGGDPRDPVAYGIVGGAFLLVGTVAALVPAARAAATDPARVLQAD